MNDKYQHIFDELFDVSLKCSNEIFYALTLLDTALSNSTAAFKEAVKEKLDNNNFSEAQELIECCTKTEKLSDEINSILNYVSEKVVKSKIIETDNNSIVEKDKENTEKPFSIDFEETSIPVDYSKYETNRYECHTLDEDFMHKKICAFELNGVYRDVHNWKNALVRLCEMLAREDLNKLKSFVNNPDFKGRKNTYFLNEYVPERNQRIGNTDIYVWTNLSANDTVKLIKNILNHYDVPISAFIVYLRADYSELHK